MCKYALRLSNRKLSETQGVRLPSCHLLGIWAGKGQILRSARRDHINHLGMHFAFSVTCTDTYQPVHRHSGRGCKSWVLWLGLEQSEAL